MNSELARLQAYPFERLALLFKDVTPASAYTPISLSIGEPKHASPAFVKQSLIDNLSQLAGWRLNVGAPGSGVPPLMAQLLAASGLEHPEELGPEHIIRRVSSTEVRSLAKLHHFVPQGQLLEAVPEHAVFQVFWDQARAESFSPPPKAAEMQASKQQ